MDKPTEAAARAEIQAADLRRQAAALERRAGEKELLAWEGLIRGDSLDRTVASECQWRHKAQMAEVSELRRRADALTLKARELDDKELSNGTA